MGEVGGQDRAGRELMFIRCCLARLVSPSLTPTS
jgi:hypothetical protein